MTYQLGPGKGLEEYIAKLEADNAALAQIYLRCADQLHQTQADNTALRDECQVLRQRLEALLTIIHNLRTCKGNATDDGPCGQCTHAADTALASQPESET